MCEGSFSVVLDGSFWRRMGFVMVFATFCRSFMEAIVTVVLLSPWCVGSSAISM